MTRALLPPNYRPVRFAEERAPCGRPGLAWVHSSRIMRGPMPDLSDCLASWPRTHPWLLFIWEPLPTKAPGPHLVHAHCCYINTVKFYYRPYIVDEFTRFFRSAGGKLLASKVGFLEWDEVETRLTWDDIVRFEGETFRVCGGTVLWRHSRWWMCRRAQRGSRREP